MDMDCCLHLWYNERKRAWKSNRYGSMPMFNAIGARRILVNGASFDTHKDFPNGGTNDERRIFESCRCDTADSGRRLCL